MYQAARFAHCSNTVLTALLQSELLIRVHLQLQPVKNQLKLLKLLKMQLHQALTAQMQAKQKFRKLHLQKQKQLRAAKLPAQKIMLLPNPKHLLKKKIQLMLLPQLLLQQINLQPQYLQQHLLKTHKIKHLLLQTTQVIQFLLPLRM